MKNRPIRVELLRADTDGRTDMTKLVVDLRDFTNVPKEKALYITALSLHVPASTLTDSHEILQEFYATGGRPRLYTSGSQPF